MKKICYVVTIPLTIRSFFIPQLRYLADNGYDVTVVCSDDGLIEKELGNNIKFHGCNIPRGLSVIGTAKAIFSLISYFKKEKFDLIQYSTPNAAFCAAIASKIAGCRIRNYHLMGFRYLGALGTAKAILKAIEKVTCGLSTSIECVSKSNLELGISEGIFKKGKATVVWNGSSGGVDLERFDINKRSLWRVELRSQLGYAEDDFIYGFVGRITKDKGINELLEAFFSLQDDSKLFVIGPNENDGTIDELLWHKAEQSKNVVIHKSSNEIEKYYAMIDILVLPSYREGFGNVVVEAAAMGTPAIVSDIVGPIDTISAGETAITVEVKNVSELANKMKYMQMIDYKKMGQDAERFVEGKFDSKVLCSEILLRKNTLLNDEVL